MRPPAYAGSLRMSAAVMTVPTGEPAGTMTWMSASPGGCMAFGSTLYHPTARTEAVWLSTSSAEKSHNGEKVAGVSWPSAW